MSFQTNFITSGQNNFILDKKTIDDQEDSKLLQLPNEIIKFILEFSSCFTSLVRFSAVCKKCYDITYAAPLAWKTLFQRLFPNNQRQYEPSISWITQFFIEHKKIKEEISKEVLEVFGGPEGILALPEIKDELLASHVMNEEYFKEIFHQPWDASKEKIEEIDKNLSTVFNPHPIVRGRDKMGQFFILINYLLFNSSQHFQLHILIMHHNKKALWRGAFFAKDLKHEKADLISWHKKFLSGSVCSINELHFTHPLLSNISTASAKISPYQRDKALFYA